MLFRCLSETGIPPISDYCQMSVRWKSDFLLRCDSHLFQTTQFRHLSDTFQTYLSSSVCCYRMFNPKGCYYRKINSCFGCSQLPLARTLVINTGKQFHPYIGTRLLRFCVVIILPLRAWACTRNDA